MKTDREAALSVLGKSIDGQRATFEKIIESLAKDRAELLKGYHLIEQDRADLLAALKDAASELDACTWADMEGETDMLKATVSRWEALIARIEGTHA
jgi:hypothetical protein